MGIEYFLPLQRTLKQWSDRKKWVEEPLFKSYVFLKIDLERSFYQTLSVAGASRFITFNGRPTEVDSREIDLVKRLLGKLDDLSIIDACSGSLMHQEGEEIQVIAGPLLGCDGKFIKRKGSQHVLIELRTMQQIMCVSMPSEYIRVKKNNTIKIA
jgi:transcription antitermination factor NusG